MGAEYVVAIATLVTSKVVGASLMRRFRGTGTRKIARGRVTTIVARVTFCTK